MDAAGETRKLEKLKGHRLGPYMSFNPVSAAQIWQWCSAMGDNNPAYLPGDSQLAPPAMMQMWTMRDINDRYAPGSTDAPPYQVFDAMEAMGYPANVAVSYDISIHRYLRLQERPMHYTTVVNISDKKTTGLGVGFFVTEHVEYLTQDERLFAEALITYFQYQPTVVEGQGDSAEGATAASAAIGAEQAGGRCGDGQPGFSNIDIARLQVGDELPELLIPITHKLIIGGAIATQDFIPVHHNVPAARAAGMSDIFMNILTTSGLLGRYLGDWAGSNSRLESIAFKLMAPNFPGDTMVLQGEVTQVSPTSHGVQAVVAFGAKNRLGYHARGTATLALPDSELSL
jgi:hypothetical protein